jgi:hypothetical protein
MKRTSFVVLTIGFSLFFIAPAGAQDDPKVPSLSLLGDDPVHFVVEDEVATADLLIKNAGSDADSTRIRLFLEDGKEVSAAPEAVAIDAGTVEPVSVEVDVSKQDLSNGQLVIDDADTDDEPASVSFGVTWGESWRLWALILGALVLAFLTALLIYSVRSAGQQDRYSLKKLLKETASWSFGDSFASTITLAGGTLGTVLAATDWLSDIAPQFPSEEFLGLNLLFVALALLAPIAYTAFQKEEQEAGKDVVYGTYGGLIFAAILTLWAVFGEIGTLGVLLWSTGWGFVARIILMVLLAGSVLLMIRYAWNTIRNISNEASPAPQQLDLLSRFAAAPEPGGGTPVIVLAQPETMRSPIL